MHVVFASFRFDHQQDNKHGMVEPTLVESKEEEKRALAHAKYGLMIRGIAFATCVLR